jgi:hypothetical protein
MLEPKLKVSVDYENVIPRDAAKASVLLFLNVLLSSGSKKDRTIYPIPFRAFVRSVGHVLIPAPWRQSGCCKRTHISYTQLMEDLCHANI